MFIVDKNLQFEKKTKSFLFHFFVRYLTFFYLSPKGKHISMCFGENKGFTLHTFARKTIGVRARSDLGGRRPVCPKKLRSAPLLDCRNQLFTPSKCTKKHAFTIVERHKIVRNRNTVFRTSHTLCRFTRCSNDRVTKQATRSSN